MYFNQNNNFYHGIMFHHFHDNAIHTKVQGSIDKNDFFKMINFIGRKNILDADVFYEKFKNNKLKNNEVCLTFDDAIKCQIDIARPVLEELKIKSLFFVYTSIFEGKPDNLEIFRYFRANYFNSINKFYDEFYKILDKDLDSFFEMNKKKIDIKKKKYNFYSYEDIKFRLVRDIFLSKDDYEKNMFLMLKEFKVDIENQKLKLFFNEKDLIKLDKLGHVIGLHSHNHPTKIENLSYSEQKLEYSTNLNNLIKILKKSSNSIKFSSHPCGSYDKNSLKVLNELGIDIAFKDSMTVDYEMGMNSINNSSLEIARQDHVEILKMMN